METPKQGDLTCHYNDQDSATLMGLGNEWKASLDELVRRFTTAQKLSCFMTVLKPFESIMSDARTVRVVWYVYLKLIFPDKHPEEQKDIFMSNG